MGDVSIEQTGDGVVWDGWATRDVDALADAVPIRLELYLRTTAPSFGLGEYYDRVTERVHDLERDGIVRECDRIVWGDRLPLRVDETNPDRTSAALAEFRTWARQEGCDLPFHVRRRQSSIIGERTAVLVPPHITLAAYADDELAGVAPATKGNQSTSVMAVLRLLANAEGLDDRRASLSR